MRFCPKCGASEKEKKFHEGFCLDCYLSAHDVLTVPDKLEITKCPDCGKIKYGKDYKAGAKKLVENKTRFQGDTQKIEIEFKNDHAEITVEGLLDSKTPVKQTKTVPVVWKKKTCDECYKFKSKYYECEVQLRGPKKIVNKALDHLNADQVSDYKDVKNGSDIYFPKKKDGVEYAQKVAKKLSAKTKRVPTLVGVTKEGKKKYKDTIAVHF